MSEQALKEVEAAQERLRKNQTIQLDCAPGGMRPGDLIADVIKDTGLEAKDTCFKLFGCWAWDYSEVPADEWAKIRVKLKHRIVRLYSRGLIRYGSW